jgi:hypothetical protein
MVVTLGARVLSKSREPGPVLASGSLVHVSRVFGSQSGRSSPRFRVEARSGDHCEHTQRCFTRSTFPHRRRRRRRQFHSSAPRPRRRRRRNFCSYTSLFLSLYLASHLSVVVAKWTWTLNPARSTSRIGRALASLIHRLQ